MTDQMQVIRDDIAYMRALADEGRRAPPLGGAILLASGLIWSATSVAVGVIGNRLVGLSPNWANAAWLVGMVAFFVALAVLIRRHRGKPGASAVNNRVMRIAWTALGWSIFTFAAATAAVCWRLHTAAPASMMVSYVLTVYGVGWTVAASMSDRPWLRWTAIASFAAAVLLGFMAASPSLYLVYAAALLLLMALPGYLLLRQEPSTTV